MRQILAQAQNGEYTVLFLATIAYKLDIASPRFVTGARACDTHFYKRGSYPLDLLTPVTIIWQPVNAPAVRSSETEDADKTEGSGPSKSRKRKGKSKEKGDANPSTSTPPNRLLWIKVHPSMFHEVYVELRDAASFALETVKKSAQAGEPELTVEMADLRNKLNVFELMGPKSSQVIRGALKPVIEDKREELNKVSTDAIVDLPPADDGYSKVLGRIR